MSNVARFVNLVTANGSDAIYHREGAGTIDCPCKTPEGYRDLKWHRDNPTEPMCNEQGELQAAVTELGIKGFIQPVQSGATRRLTSDYATQLFGEVEADDHVGIFPLSWAGTPLDFRDWSAAGEDYILYDSRRFIVRNSNMIPDPAGGGNHHWEVGLRLVRTDRNVT